MTQLHSEYNFPQTKINKICVNIQLHRISVVIFKLGCWWNILWKVIWTSFIQQTVGFAYTLCLQLDSASYIGLINQKIVRAKTAVLHSYRYIFNI